MYYVELDEEYGGEKENRVSSNWRLEIKTSRRAKITKRVLTSCETA